MALLELIEEARRKQTLRGVDGVSVVAVGKEGRFVVVMFIESLVYYVTHGTSTSRDSALLRRMDWQRVGKVRGQGVRIYVCL